ncbi:hypothetical protein [Coralloluteibacterium stylophorae]|uniref:Uncharacterized protein n=1 Tax=Coralloluteibacterium stylophorae TaxID=1776034 RepID=A0A8J7VRD5_9GAMM|nr:hypothetical protein [Coralloluteibacterium stylophorae]MBS7457683.1 hypothetical protein [Coralloluteibacterium stylophorae]
MTLRALLPYLLTLLCAAVLFGSGYHLADSLNDSSARADAAEGQVAELEVALANAEATERVVTKYVDRVVEVQGQTHTVIKEIPVYVTREADARCVVPRGFVWLHDAAAGLSALPESAGDADAPAEGVGLSRVAEVVGGNYGTCRETAEQLRGLQEWVRSQQ